MNFDAMKLIAELLKGKGAANGGAQETYERPRGRYDDTAQIVRTPFAMQNGIGEKVETFSSGREANPLLDALKGGGSGDALSALLPLLMNVAKGGRKADEGKTPPREECGDKSSSPTLEEKLAMAMRGFAGNQTPNPGGAKRETAQREDDCKCNTRDGSYSPGPSQDSCRPNTSQDSCSPNTSRDNYRPDAASEKTRCRCAPYEQEQKRERNDDPFCESPSDERRSRKTPCRPFQSGSGIEKFQPISFSGYALISALNRLFNAKRTCS